MNEKLVKIFTDLAVYEDSLKRLFPAKAYRNAAKIFKEFPIEITDAAQIKDTPGIGDGIFKKVQEYLSTGSFKKYEEYLSSDVSRYRELSEIKGIGMAKAKLLFESGITSIEQLKSISSSLKVNEVIPGTSLKLTNSMKIGLEFEAHTDKNRMTVSEHDSVADPILSELRRDPLVVRAEAVGSRRRFDGSSDYTIGDIDIIIFLEKNNLDSFYKSLERFLDKVIMSGKTKVSGIKNKRQVDFRIVDKKFTGSLLLHATGPASFNVSLRKLAMKNNWTLNEYGLYDENNSLIESENEEEILNKLHVGWIDPSNRKNFK